MNIIEYYKHNIVEEDFEENFYVSQNKELENFYQPYCKNNKITERQRLFYHYFFYGKNIGMFKNSTEKEANITKKREEQKRLKEEEEKRRLEKIFNQLEFPKYEKLNHDIVVVIAFFSPCNFKLPRKNIQIVIKKLLAANYPVVVVEAVFPDAKPLILPKEVDHKQYRVNKKSTLFLKENLYNLAIKNTNHSKFVFMDNDIEFSDSNWLNKTAALLDYHDIIQPFEACYWLDQKHKKFIMEKQNCIKPIFENKPFLGSFYNPGFVWAFRRDFLESVNGFYDLHPLGGSDTAFWWSLTKNEPTEIQLKYWIETKNHFAETPDYIKYRDKIRKLSPRINYLPGNFIRHFWHGHLEDRKYSTRGEFYMPDLFDNDLPLIRNELGILEWTKIEYAEKCLQYFIDRKEDG